MASQRKAVYGGMIRAISVIGAISVLGVISAINAIIAGEESLMKQRLFLDLEQEIIETQRIIQKTIKELKKLPEGNLEVGRVQKKYVQYHAVFVKNGRRERSYITRDNMKLARQLAQRSYENRLVKAASEKLRGLTQVMKVLKENDLPDVYERETPERRELITPMIPTDKLYVEQWYAEHMGDENSFPMTTAYTTIRGETVRSKSEKMIADTYYTEGVPYVYEPKLILPNGRVVYPDFAVLNVSERKTLYHEHFGMMDDEEYRKNAVDKIRRYNANGYWAGDSMLFTFEGETIPFDQEELARIVHEKLQ